MRWWDIDEAVADTLERLSTTLSRANVHAYLSDLPQDVDIDALALSASVPFTTHFDSTLLGGITVLKTKAQHLPSRGWCASLYSAGAGPWFSVP